MPTETLRPNGAGDESNLTIGGSVPAATRWESVDEAVADDGVTFVYDSQAEDKRDLYAIENSAIGQGTINSVTVYARCVVTGGGGTLYIALKSGGVVGVSSAKTLTGSYANYSNTWASPPEGGIWTWTKINALQAGIRLVTSNDKGASSACTQVYIVVDYIADRFASGEMIGIGTAIISVSVHASGEIIGIGTAALIATVLHRHEYWQKSTRVRIITPNKITVRTRPDEGGTAYSGSATDPASYQKLPKEDFVYARLTSNTEGANIAAAKIDRLSRDSESGSGFVLMNVGQEVLDWVLITDTWGNDAARGRIRTIYRHAGNGKFEMGISFSSRIPQFPFGTLQSMMFEAKLGEPVPEWAKELMEIMFANDNMLIDNQNEIIKTLNSVIRSNTSVNDRTSSRAIDGTVYRNTIGGRVRLVAVNVACEIYGTAGVSQVTAYCDGSNPPTTQVQMAGHNILIDGEGVSIAAESYFTIIFAVPRGYYYKLVSLNQQNGSPPALLDWFEFDSI